MTLTRRSPIGAAIAAPAQRHARTLPSRPTVVALVRALRTPDVAQVVVINPVQRGNPRREITPFGRPAPSTPRMFPTCGSSNRQSMRLCRKERSLDAATPARTASSPTMRGRVTAMRERVS
jgi:hypothetical protein